ncbi:MAG TPA: hypothetical protein VGN80_02490 [Devosiaceae bacterium]|nr:hypothetical protein [Devosiaceae bacterium]
MQSSPSTLPTGRDRATGLASVTAISFSLTFVGVSLALLAGLLPERVANIGASIDVGVLLLFLPLCALAFAISVEVVRAARKGPLRYSAPPRARPLSGWRPEGDRG